MKDSIVWKIARSNKKLSNSFYKTMIKNSPLVSRMSIIKFKACFHSKYTLPEYRAMLISSLFEKRPKYQEILAAEYPHRISPRQTIKLDPIKYRGQDAFSLQIRDPIKKPRRLGLDKTMREFIRDWRITRNRETILEKALLSDNLHYQRVSVGLGEMSRMLFAIADNMKAFVFRNDPRKLYNTSPTDEEDLETLARSPYRGLLTQNAERFNNDLQALWSEYKKFEPFFSKLGIDTTNFDMHINVIGGLLNTFSSTQYADFEDELDGLYQIHEQGQPLAQEALELARSLEQIDVNSEVIYRIGRMETIPKFVDTSKSASVLTHRSRALNVGTSHALRMTVYKLTPADVRDFAHPETAIEWRRRQELKIGWLDPWKKDTS